MSTDSMGQWDIDDELVAEVEREGNRQLELGYDEAHDDRHTVSQFQQHIWRYGVKAANAADGHDMPRARRRLVQICALAFKALQAFDRRYQIQTPPEPLTATGHICENCVHVPPKSASWTRPFCLVIGDYITRDGMACGKWNHN